MSVCVRVCVHVWVWVQGDMWHRRGHPHTGFYESFQHQGAKRWGGGTIQRVSECVGVRVCVLREVCACWRTYTWQRRLSLAISRGRVGFSRHLSHPLGAAPTHARTAPPTPAHPLTRPAEPPQHMQAPSSARRSAERPHNPSPGP